MKTDQHPVPPHRQRPVPPRRHGLSGPRPYDVGLYDLGLYDFSLYDVSLYDLSLYDFILSRRAVHVLHVVHIHPGLNGHQSSETIHVLHNHPVSHIDQPRIPLSNSC